VSLPPWVRHIMRDGNRDAASIDRAEKLAASRFWSPFRGSSSMVRESLFCLDTEMHQNSFWIKLSLCNGKVIAGGSVIDDVGEPQDNGWFSRASDVVRTGPIHYRDVKRMFEAQRSGMKVGAKKNKPD
jgi:hypothetical protein